MSELRIVCSRQLFSNRIELRMVEMIPEQRRRSKVMPLTLVEMSDDDVVEPCLTMQLEEAQKLIDSLWDCGLRPSEGTGSAGAMAATQRHLEDMRKLVFAEKKP